MTIDLNVDRGEGEALFAWTDDIVRRWVAKVDQSILGRAFRGEL